MNSSSYQPEQGGTRTTTGAESLYLDLLKQVLTRSGFVSYQQPRPLGWKRLLYGPLKAALEARQLQLLKRVEPSARLEGSDLPADAETMVGIKRLDNLQHCIANILANRVPGDLIETGVWRGGASIFMRAVLKAYGESERTVWVADSFRGLPKPSLARGSADIGDQLWQLPELAVPLEEVQANFLRYGLLDQQVQFLAGWFQDTLPNAPIQTLALLRLDGDMYESTLVGLESLYPKLSPGGYVIVDDYYAVEGCKEAVDEFRSRERIGDDLQQIDWTAVFWQRS